MKERLMIGSVSSRCLGMSPRSPPERLSVGKHGLISEQRLDTEPRLMREDKKIALHCERAMVSVNLSIVLHCEEDISSGSFHIFFSLHLVHNHISFGFMTFMHSVEVLYARSPLVNMVHYMYLTESWHFLVLLLKAGEL